MKTIPLTRGQHAIVDDEDFGRLSQWKWCALRTKGGFYAARGASVNGSKNMVLMHRFILGARPGQIVDHENRNGLDNRRVNLRACSQSQNMLNSKGHRDRKSRFKGAYRHERGWVSYYRGRYIGVFKREENAALSYNLVAYMASPEFARMDRG